MKTVEDGALLPASELAVMNGIWSAYADLHRPVTTREVINHNSELTRWNHVTVLTFIGRLNGRGFVRVEKPGAVGKINVYMPLILQSEYKRLAYQDFIEKTMRGDRMELTRLLISDMEPEELKRASSNIPQNSSES